MAFAHADDRCLIFVITDGGDDEYILRAIMDDAKTMCQRDFGAMVAVIIGKRATRGLS